MEDDYLLDEEEEDLENQGYLGPDETGDDSDDDNSEGSDESIIGDDEDEKKIKVDESQYEGKMTKDELWLSTAYDDIIAAGKLDKDNAIEDAVTTIVWANPKHTSVNTVGNIIKDLFHKQGHSRMVNSFYTPDTPLRGEDVDIDFKDEDDSGFNKRYAEEARNQIARFIEFLATRDISKDSIISKRRKQRQIPAFIIFLFSSGMYDLIVECPTMPEEYATQIKEAMRKILKAKYDIVEELAKKYEEMGRQAVADRVRKLQLSWFNKEPAEIRSSAEYSDLELTYDDVLVYREYRSRFTNTSRAITQDIISDMIEVVIDKEAGVYERLKDKTRSDAISDVKQVYKDWSKNNPDDSELATKIIWKDVEGMAVSYTHLTLPTNREV